MNGDEEEQLELYGREIVPLLRGGWRHESHAPQPLLPRRLPDLRRPGAAAGADLRAASSSSRTATTAMSSRAWRGCCCSAWRSWSTQIIRHRIEVLYPTTLVVRLFFLVVLAYLFLQQQRPVLPGRLRDRRCWASSSPATPTSPSAERMTDLDELETAAEQRWLASVADRTDPDPLRGAATAGRRPRAGPDPARHLRRAAAASPTSGRTARCSSSSCATSAARA